MSFWLVMITDTQCAQPLQTYEASGDGVLHCATDPKSTCTMNDTGAAFSVRYESSIYHQLRP